MKKTLLIAAAAAITFTSVAASAQPYGYGRGAYESRYRDSDRDGRSDRREWNRDRDRDGRPDQYDRYDNRRGGNRYGYANQRYRTGGHYPYYRDRGYYISDYRAYRLPPPRPGYRYYRSDNGDIVMAAIASGLIGLVIGSALSDNNDHRDYRRDYYGRW